MDQTRKQLAWKAINAGIAAVSVLVTRRVLTAVWQRFGTEPPGGPDDRTATWRSALTWALATGVGVAVARVVAVRLSARVWEAAMHEAPPVWAQL